MTRTSQPQRVSAPHLARQCTHLLRLLQCFLLESRIVRSVLLSYRGDEWIIWIGFEEELMKTPEDCTKCISLLDFTRSVCMLTRLRSARVLLQLSYVSTQSEV